MNGVRVRGLRKSFHHLRRSIDVLKGIDLEIAPGEVVGLIGPNGAGKTTLMSCLLGFLNPDTGDVTIDGLPTHDLGIRRRTGFVPERMNFGRTATSRAFLRYMGRLAEIPRGDVDQRVDDLLGRMGVAHGASMKLSEHSRGMLQRVGMCQALLREPDYLFLDEPASGLDPNGVILVRDVILEQKARGSAVLLNSHQLSEVEKVCDRVLFLSNGVIARDERLRTERTMAVAVTMLPGFDVDAVMRAANGIITHNAVVFEVAAEPEIAERVRAIVATGAGVVGVRRHTADLEQMFRADS